MLEIKPCTDKQTILPYCKKAGLPYTEAFYLYRALDSVKVLAAGLFQVGGNQVDVVLYESGEPGDHFLFDAVLRAGLNYAASFDIQSGHIPEPFRQRHEKLFEKLNFPPDPVFGISNFFTKYKNCVP